MNLATMAAGANGPPLSFPAYITNMVKTQGVMSLYSGLSAGLLRQCFYATSRVGFFELLRDEMAKYRPTDFLSRLVVGVVSGGMAAVISCPAEVTLVRMSNDATMEPAKRRNYTGVSNAFARILREEGVKTFFTGSVHTHLILLASYLSLPITAILRVKTFFTGSTLKQCHALHTNASCIFPLPIYTLRASPPLCLSRSRSRSLIPRSPPYGQIGTLCQPSNVGGCSPGTHPSHHITRPVNTFSKSVLPYPQLILTNHHHYHYRHRRWAHMTSFVAYIAPNMV